jgi:hypothetical protein
MAGRASLVVAVGIAASLAAVSTLHAQANDGEAFKARLLAALASGNGRQVAALVQYPIRVNHGMLPYPVLVEDAAAMTRLHTQLFTPEMRCRIEQSRLQRDGEAPPKYPMRVSDGVVTLADGLIVAVRTPAGYRINRLSVIGQAPAPNARPRDVLFRWGEGETQYAGRLGTNAVDAYVVNAPRGALLQARIERFPGRSLQMRVTDQDGTVITGAKTEFSRLWAARVPAAGRYRIDIIRHGGACEAAVTYLLTLGLRTTE